MYRLLYNEDMRTLNYSEARQDLANTMEAVCDDHTPIMITRQRARPVVMMSLEDYNSMEETAYLMRSPANHKRILEAMADVKKGKAQERELID
jgi:antitoxin YefM